MTVEPEQPSEEQLWSYLGLSSRYQRESVVHLMEAKARARLADLNPWSAPAVALIDRYVDTLVARETQRLKDERAAALELIKGYQEGTLTLDDLVSGLRDVAGDLDE